MSTSKKLFPYLLTCSLVVAGAVACSGESDNTASDDCADKCSETQTCVSGKCVDDNSQQCDPACVDGQICKDGQCVENSEKICDPACVDGQICKDGQCVENSEKICDPACVDGQICKDGQCVENTEKTCEPACEEGEICEDGKCVDSDVGIDDIECSPECEDNQICSNGKCVKNDEPVPPEDIKTPAFNVTPLDGLVTVQNIVNAEFSVILGKAPQKNVIIPIKSNAPELGKLSAQKVTFTTDNWNTPQKITITATTETQDNPQTPYTIVVGPSQSEDKDYNNLKAVEVQVTHHNQYQSTDAVTLSLDKTEAKLFLRKVKHNNASASEENSITIHAKLNEDTKDQNIFWKFENVTDKVDYTHLIDVVYDDIDKSGTARTVKIVRKEYGLNSNANISKKLDLARTIKVTVSHVSGKNASATIELKPYLAPGFSYSYITKNIRDYAYIKKGNDEISNKDKGDFECGYYDEHTTQVLNYDMMHDYVEPKMYKAKDGKLYPTRASVVAAARFIVTQFPKDIAYISQNAFVQPKDTKRPLTLSSYIWAKSYDEKAPEIDNYRLYGFNLTDTGYNSPSFAEKNKIKKDGIPWNCSFGKYYNQELKNTKGEVLPEQYNGLRCTGFVTWAMRNGRFGLGDVYASVFGQNYPKSPKRMYSDPEKTSYFKGGKTLRDHENVYEKLNKLEESDFVYLGDLNEKKAREIKAGDILWYFYYNCEAGKKCPEQCEPSGGHFELVLGITYNSDKTIKYFYVGNAGNRLSVKTVDDMKNWGWVSSRDKDKPDAWGKVFKEGDVCKDRRIVKMGHVYNYYSDLLKESGYEGDTYQYTDMWWQ